LCGWFGTENLGFAENESNGTVGQFAKRQDIPYPANEDTIEEERVAAINAPLVADLPEFASLLETTVSDILYALVTNPFYGYDKGVDAGASSQEELYLVDGSETGQVRTGREYANPVGANADPIVL
jgi:lysophospholipase